MLWPIGSRFIQRSSDATQSRASTGSPSWNSRPSRSRMVQRRPLSSTLWPSTICGFGSSFSSRPYSVSNIMRGAIPGDDRGGPYRIEAGEIGLRHVDQRLRLAADGGLRQRASGRTAAVAAPARKSRRFIRDVLRDRLCRYLPTCGQCSIHTAIRQVWRPAAQPCSRRSATMHMSADRVGCDRVCGDVADCRCRERLRVGPVARITGSPGRAQPGVLIDQDLRTGQLIRRQAEDDRQCGPGFRFARKARTLRPRPALAHHEDCRDVDASRRDRSACSSPELAMIRSMRPLRSSRSIVRSPPHSASNCGIGSGCGHLPDLRMLSPAFAPAGSRSGPSARRSTERRRRPAS